MLWLSDEKSEQLPLDFCPAEASVPLEPKSSAEIPKLPPPRAGFVTFQRQRSRERQGLAASSAPASARSPPGVSKCSMGFGSAATKSLSNSVSKKGSLSKRYKLLIEMETELQTSIKEKLNVKRVAREKMVEVLTKRVHSNMMPPYFPPFLQRRVEPLADRAVAFLHKEFVTKMHQEEGVAAKAYREMRIDFWSTESRWCTLEWTRAKFLYALDPADGNVWRTLQEPLSALIYVLKIWPVTSVPMFLIYFALIDRTDEYQLCNFILRFKCFQFVTAGLGIAVVIAASEYMCLVHEMQGEIAGHEGAECLRTFYGLSILNVYIKFPLDPIPSDPIRSPSDPI